MADRAWQQHPSAVAGPGPASRRRTKPTSKPRDGPRSDRAWQQHPSAVARPGPASRSTTPSPQARVWRSRGRAAAHGRIKQPGPTGTRHQTRATRHAPRNAPPDTRPDTCHQARATRHAPGTPAAPQTHTRSNTKRAGTSRFRPALDTQRLSAPRARWRHAAGGATRQVSTSAPPQSAVSSARPPCRPCRSSRR